MCHDCVFERFHVLCVDGRKGFEGFLFAIEQLQHHHAAHVLLQVGIDAGNCNSNSPIRISHSIAEQFCRHGNERKHGECDQRQLPVHTEHDRQNPGENKDVLENRDHTRSEHFVQCIHVGGDASD